MKIFAEICAAMKPNGGTLKSPAAQKRLRFKPQRPKNKFSKDIISDLGGRNYGIDF